MEQSSIERSRGNRWVDRSNRGASGWARDLAAVACRGWSPSPAACTPRCVCRSSSWSGYDTSDIDRVCRSTRRRCKCAGKVAGLAIAESIGRRRTAVRPQYSRGNRSPDRHPGRTILGRRGHWQRCRCCCCCRAQRARVPANPGLTTSRRSHRSCSSYPWPGRVAAEKRTNCTTSRISGRRRHFLQAMFLSIYLSRKTFRNFRRLDILRSDNSWHLDLWPLKSEHCIELRRLVSTHL